MEQVAKDGSTTIQVEGLDAIPTIIYRKEDHPRRKIILEGGSEEVVRESDHCIFEDFVYIYIYIYACLNMVMHFV